MTGSITDPSHRVGGHPLRARRLGIHAQHDSVAFMRTDCHVCRSEGLSARSQVLVRTNGRDTLATLYQVSSDLIDIDEVGLSEAAWMRLQASDGDNVTVRHADPVESLGEMRRRIYARSSAKVETRAIGGWSGYIQKYRRTGPVNAKEQTTFLNMWLDKFVFCGRSAGPTSVYLSAAERLADGGRFPLGRYLLGSAYHLLHQVARKLLLGQPIGNLGGPWWFINMWLNLHMHKHHEFDLFAQRFPRDIAEDYELDEEESATRSPLNFGEAAIVLPGTGGNEDQFSQFFQTLHEGLTRE
jgi:hypothetical protein